MLLVAFWAYQKMQPRIMVPTSDQPQVVFVHYPVGRIHGQIHIMNLDGSGHRVLATGAGGLFMLREPAFLRGPVLSPDRRLIAFVSTQNYTSDIWVMNVDGSQRTNVTRTSNQDEGKPEWTADGTGIIYRSNRSHVSEPAGEWMIMKIDGSQVRKVSRVQANVLRNRAGKMVKLANSQAQDGALLTDIVIANADGSGPHRITNNAEAKPSERAAYYQARLSPDGQRVAAMRYNAMSKELWVMNADGTGQQRLDQTGKRGGDPVFTPDSQSIVYEANHDGDDEIYIVTPGQAPVQLTHNSLNDGSPDVR
jgi:TolB protein